MNKPCRLLLSLLLALTFGALVQINSQKADAAQHLSFRVAVDPALAPQPVSGRLLIFMTTQAEAGEMIEPDFLNPKNVWITGIEIHNLDARKNVDVDPDALAFPGPFSEAPPGDYRVMALLDTDHSYTYNAAGPGDLYSTIVTAHNLSPASSEAVELTLNKEVPARKLADTENIKLVEFESPSLTAFWGRTIKLHAGIVLPPSYAKSPAKRYPTVYVVHGYGGSHATAWIRGPDQIKEMAEGKTPEMIYVYLNAHCPLGHHVFADSANNGPWGHALTAEFIPFLEKRFRMDRVPKGRLLTGHSSGGWSTLWLQVTYPNVFGGTWSTSPDPVDFRAFTGPDLTKYPPQNFYRGSEGTPYNLVRYHGREIMTLEDYARLELVEGYYGGQMASFEAVFSPRGDDGQPMQLFDRATGRINPLVAKAWERYDIDRILRTNWPRLRPKLRGKLHIIVGTEDTFHLEEGVSLLRDTLKRLGSDAQIEFLQGRDHFDLYQNGLSKRIAEEMYTAARLQGLKPTPVLKQKKQQRTTNVPSTLRTNSNADNFLM